MNSITEHIQYLILRHDCVIIPGFGALVAQYEPARISPDGTSIMPPRRVLGFNRAVQHDDGLLIGSVARREGMSYDAARMEVEREVVTMRHRIDAGEEVMVSRIGVFGQGNADVALVFTPAYETGIADSMYNGLPQLSVLPINAVVAEPNIMEMDYEPKHNVRHRVISAMKYAASVAVLVGLGLTLTTPLSVDRNSVDFAALATPKVKMTSLPTVKADASHELFVAIPDAEDATAQVDAHEQDYRYFLVIASCASRGEAMRYIKCQNMPDVAMEVLERDGRHRVYVAAAYKEEAIAKFKGANAEFMEKHPDAWVYARY